MIFAIGLMIGAVIALSFVYGEMYRMASRPGRRDVEHLMDVGDWAEHHLVYHHHLPWCEECLEYHHHEACNL